MAARNFGIVPYDAIIRDPVNTNTFSQEKKNFNHPCPVKARFKSPGGFSEGVWSGSSAALRPAATCTIPCLLRSQSAIEIPAKPAYRCIEV